MTKTRLVYIIMTLVCLTILLSLHGISSNAQSLSSEISEAIDSFVQEEMRKNRIPGLSVGIVEGNEVIYLRGFGDAGSDRQVTPQTSFIIGSMSKSFTALAIMQLVEAGRIDPIKES